MLFFPALLLALASASAASPSAAAGWRPLARGADLRIIDAGKPSAVGDSRITVVRFDPDHWRMEFAGISRTGDMSGRTAREWSKDRKFSAAINAGMYGTDYSTHVGYLRFREHVNSAGVNAYQSVAAFDPRRKELQPFRIFDLDAPGVTMEAILKDYASAIQNLRLIKRPGSNRWSRQEKRWSEAALGEDDSGRILLIFCRSPFSMRELNEELLAAGIGIVAAQHLEGGPEAQLYLHVGDLELELFGSYETSFREDEGNTAPYPVPNVLGIRPR